MLRVRLVLAALVAMLLVLQYHIWFGAADVFDARALRQGMSEQKAENERLRERNAALAAEVRDLKQGTEAVEERARSDLGMVKKDETFYQIVARPKAPATAPASGTGPAAAPASQGAPRPAGTPP